MKRAIVYLRVSTETQDTAMQRTDLLKYCDLHNLEPVIFEDHASGKSINKRPALKEAMDLVRSGTISCFLIWRVDRIARNVRDFIGLHEEMEEYDVKLVSFNDHLDFSTPMGMMMCQMLAIFAQFESGLNSARTKAGMAEARKKGAKFGAKPIDFPLSEALDLKKKGLTYTEIAAKLSVGRTTVCKHLKLAQ